MKLIALLAAVLLRHDDSISSSRVDIGRSDATVTFTMSIEDLATIVDVPDSLDARAYEAMLPQVFAYLSKRLQVSNDGQPCAAELVRGVFPGERPVPSSAKRTPFGIILRYASERPIGALRVRCEVLRDRVKNHKHIADFSDGRTVVFEGDRVEMEWSAPRTWGADLIQFVVLGVEHIVTGWDHLAFLLALLLVAASAKRVVQLVTAFTVAHSVTLGLTALRVIGPPSGLVEAVIAASIVYVAVENLFLTGATGGRWRWALVFAFGLIHGMGFGGALVEMQLARPATALLGFNLGVELGQLFVVALTLPVLALLRRREAFYRTVVVRGLSGAAAAAGLFWFLQRVI
jgi:hydrogenase/urease accessory protein HupE